MNEIKRFILLDGGRDAKTVVNGLPVHIVADTTKPLPVDVRVFEEDTFLVLTVDPVMRFSDEHPIRLMTGVVEARPRTPGTVVMNKASWYAVVHDLDAEPSCRSEWIAEAYAAVLQQAGRKKVRKLGIPLLGSVHGRFTQRESMSSLLDQIRVFDGMQARQLTILVSAGQEIELRAMLKELGG